MRPFNELYSVVNYIRYVDDKYGLSLTIRDRNDLYHYAHDPRFEKTLTATKFKKIIRLWAGGKWHKDWDPNMLQSLQGLDTSPSGRRTSPTAALTIVGLAFLAAFYKP